MKLINSFRGKHAYLSNFFYAPIIYEGITFRSTEAAFQAMKCKHIIDRISFESLSSAESKRHGHEIEMREDWDEVKLSVMEDLNRIKFTQYNGLRTLLVGTKDAILEEGNTWDDKYWGTVNGIGENHFGKILMKLREEYKNG
jgi:ribA/ribD-fused uncharacterized protein